MMNVLRIATSLSITFPLAEIGGGPLAGRLAFMGVFVVLLVWILLMPARLIGQDDGPVAWWKNARFWAALIALIEIGVYWQFG